MFKVSTVSKNEVIDTLLNTCVDYANNVLLFTPHETKYIASVTKNFDYFDKYTADADETVFSKFSKEHNLVIEVIPDELRASHRLYEMYELNSDLTIYNNGNKREYMFITSHFRARVGNLIKETFLKVIRLHCQLVNDGEQAKQDVHSEPELETVPEPKTSEDLLPTVSEILGLEEEPELDIPELELPIPELD